MSFVVDNGRKLQSKAVTEEWKKFGITLHPGAGDVLNSAVGEFPVNHPKFNVLDQSIHHSWKNTKGGFYDRWNSQRKDRKTPEAFMRIAKESFFEMPQSKIQNAFDAQRDIILEDYRTHKPTKKST